jgi:hypothetical protein
MVQHQKLTQEASHDSSGTVTAFTSDQQPMTCVASRAASDATMGAVIPPGSVYSQTHPGLKQASLIGDKYPDLGQGFVNKFYALVAELETEASKRGAIVDRRKKAARLRGAHEPAANSKKTKKS